jgi:hypothetical protein
MKTQICSTIYRGFDFFLQCWRMSETAKAQKLFKKC